MGLAIQGLANVDAATEQLFSFLPTGWITSNKPAERMQNLRNVKPFIERLTYLKAPTEHRFTRAPLSATCIESPDQVRGDGDLYPNRRRLSD
jgi:hypothetical protein